MFGILGGVYVDYKKEIIDLIEHLENKGELEYIYTILSTY